MKLDAGHISLDAFWQASIRPELLSISEATLGKIHARHELVALAALGDDPVYGLNTGLGANLGHRLSPEEVSGFQLQIIQGRAIGCGDLLPEEVCRGLLLSRIVTAAKGYSGISLPVFEHLIRVYQSGLAPVVHKFGSIGASDLTLNGEFALAALGDGSFWKDGQVISAKQALAENELEPPILRPKDGMALINHTGLTIANSAQALVEMISALNMAKASIVLSYEGYEANANIFAEQVNELRPSPGQAKVARWFREALADASYQPRRIQEALSFRTVAPVIGAAEQALENAVSIWEDECNGVPDSPAVFENGDLSSTSNFHSPGLALAIETVSLASVSVASGIVARIKRMMEPERSGLPRYLSPAGGKNAGFVPLQKLAVNLLAELRHVANPILADPESVSDGVEDMAPMTPAVAQKLLRQTEMLQHLAGLEVLVACQAIDLRDNKKLGQFGQNIYAAVREVVTFAEHDRPLSADIKNTVQKLRSVSGLRLL